MLEVHWGMRDERANRLFATASEWVFSISWPTGTLRLKRFNYEQVTRNLVSIVVTNIKLDIPSHEAVVYISHPSWFPGKQNKRAEWSRTCCGGKGGMVFCTHFITGSKSVDRRLVKKFPLHHRPQQTCTYWSKAIAIFFRYEYTRPTPHLPRHAPY